MMCKEWNEKRIQLEEALRISIKELSEHMGTNSFYGESDDEQCHAIGPKNMLHELVPTLEKAGTVRTVDGNPIIYGMGLLPDGTDVYVVNLDRPQ
jgi:hypothetical protein